MSGEDNMRRKGFIVYLTLALMALLSILLVTRTEILRMSKKKNELLKQQIKNEVKVFNNK